MRVALTQVHGRYVLIDDRTLELEYHWHPAMHFDPDDFRRPQTILTESGRTDGEPDSVEEIAEE
jgi:hypothetical protein